MSLDGNKIMVGGSVLAIVGAGVWMFVGAPEEHRGVKEAIIVTTPVPPNPEPPLPPTTDPTNSIPIPPPGMPAIPPSEDIDERELSSLEKEILGEIQAALDAEDFNALKKALTRFKAPASKGGLGGEVPKELRSQAVTALGWFGPKGLGSLVGFMADADPEVEEDAFAQFEMALGDWSLGDGDRSEVLISVMKVIEDTDRIESMLMNLNNMRNSVKADTILEILQSGTAEAKAIMQDEIGFYTDAEVEDAKGLAEWRTSNPDEPTDDELYGPQSE